MMLDPRIEEPFLPLCKPSLTQEDIAAVTGVLRSGWLTELDPGGWTGIVT